MTKVLEPGTITKDLWEEINPEPTIEMEKREDFLQQLKVYERNRYLITLFAEPDDGFVNNCPMSIRDENGNLNHYLVHVSQYMDPSSSFVKNEFV